MKQSKKFHRLALACFVAGCLVLAPSPSLYAQDTRVTVDADEDLPAPETDDDADVSAPDGDDADGESADPGEDGDSDDEDGDGIPDKIAINLNNVKIDQVIKFLTEITGKTVVKHKDAQAQITVFSPGEVTPEAAFALICDALLLEKVAVVQNKDKITLIPRDALAEVLPDLLPEGEGEATAGIVRTVIAVRFADVAEVEKLVKPLLSKTGTLLAHPGSKNIIITDTVTRVAHVQGVITLIDVLDTDERQVQIFSLEHADAEELAPILKSVLDVLAQKLMEGAPPGQPGQPGQPPQPQPGKPGKGQAPGAGVLEVVAYKAANWLVVVAPKEILSAAQPLIEELDRERPQELSLRILVLRYADADQVARQLSTLFQKRPEKRVKDTVEITSHERSNALVILSSEENYELVARVVEELDTEESVQTMMQTFELEFADAGDIAEQMNELYQGMQQQGGYRSYYYGYSSRGQQDKTRFVAEPRTNSVLAIAKPTEFEKIAELIKKLDRPIDPEEVAPRIFHIRYVDAKEMTDVLNEIFGVADTGNSGGYYDYWYGGQNEKENQVGRLYGKVRFVPETTTNSIIVTTNNRENFKIIESFIKDLDQFNAEAANTMVVRLENAKAEELADELNSLFAREGARMPQRGQQQEEEEQRSSYYSWLYGSPQKKEERAISNLIGQVRVVPDVRINALAVTTAVQNFELIRELIEQLDIESPKVHVKVRLVEVTTTKVHRMGTRYSSDPGIFENEDLDNGLRSTFGAGWEDVYHNGTITANSEISVSLLMQFLRRNADTKILSEPTLVMNNNEPGTLFVGSRIPIIQDSQRSAEGSLTQSFEYEDAGTTLNITPNINQARKVEMKIELEASQIRPGERVQIGADIFDTRKFETELAVNSGDTIVIGGILRESEAENIRRVPILGYIPIANLVFRKKDIRRERTELIAFITPTVLETSDDDYAATREAADRVEVIEEWRPLPDPNQEPEEARGLLRKMGLRKR